MVEEHLESKSFQFLFAKKAISPFWLVLYFSRQEAWDWSEPAVSTPACFWQWRSTWPTQQAKRIPKLHYR